MLNKFSSQALAVAGVLAMTVFAAGEAKAVTATAVDVELQLLVDVSGSVSGSEFALQRDGYVNAFQSAAIQNAITDMTGGRLGKIAAQFIYWSGSGQQNIAVDWTEIGTNAQANAFATAISNASRPFSGSTAPGSAINFGAPLFGSNNFDGIAKVMDVSGDGSQNSGATTSTARDNALNSIDRINGIVIGGSSSVASFYNNNVIGGTNSFLLTANSFSDFQGAVARKLQAEISGGNPTAPIPLPAGLPLLLTGLGAIGGLGALRRRKARTA